MEAIMKQIQHQLKQKQEQKASLIRQFEAANREEEQLQQTLQILSSYSAPKEEGASSSTTKQPKEDIQEISSDDSQSQTIHKTEKQPMTSNKEEYPPLQADHKNIKKWRPGPKAVFLADSPSPEYGLAESPANTCSKSRPYSASQAMNSLSPSCKFQNKNHGIIIPETGCYNSPALISDFVLEVCYG
uniref:Uncharacterized protein n=1 Tax=Lactuca sativa TaxID=4236 RepID=A0A9R1WXK5_LACSA|nr:hypothetical protein LSAT_V11C800429030 [Lactuca sativa]